MPRRDLWSGDRRHPIAVIIRLRGIGLEQQFFVIAQTYYNGGLENHVRLLAASATPPRILVADRATQGGSTLRILHGLPSVHERIQQGHYDRVILHDDIPELTEHSIAAFQEYARRFDQGIRSHGGRSVLFMAWP